MSLDVYLTKPEESHSAGSGIFVREDGAKREIGRDEWDQKFPGLEPVTMIRDEETNEVYSANITHNLTAMAREAGIYEVLWRPEEIGIERASDLIEPLHHRLALLTLNPEMSEDATKIHVIGDTTPPDGCESAQVLGCTDFRLSPREARELARLLTKAATVAEAQS